MSSNNDFDKWYTQGWIQFDQIIDSEFVASLCAETDRIDAEFEKLRKFRGITRSDGAAHHVAAMSPKFIEFLERRYCHDFLSQYFGSRYILNSFGAISNRNAADSYLLNVHRDVRSFTGDFPLLINMLVMLDDFTLENGATYLLSGSHHKDRKPENTYFYEEAERACGKAGSIVLFNSNLWHAAGANQTSKTRRALTLNFSKPLMKPQFDYIAHYGVERVETMSENLKQLFGLYSRVPATHEEWYQPKETRFYRSDQE